LVEIHVGGHDFFHHFHDLDFLSGWEGGSVADSCKEEVGFGIGIVPSGGVELDDGAGRGVELDDKVGLGSAAGSPAYVDSCGTTVGWRQPKQ